MKEKDKFSIKSDPPIWIVLSNFKNKQLYNEIVKRLFLISYNNKRLLSKQERNLIINYFEILSSLFHKRKGTHRNLVYQL
jgi:hypothetical protein